MEEMEIKNPRVKEYRIMYLWGVWITHAKVYAETDEEAIFDADEVFKNAKNLHNWKMGVCLIQGDRFVKTYVERTR